MIVSASYEAVRYRMKPGDIIAFGGRGFVSWIIKTWTWFPVSHVGIVVRVEEGRARIMVTESTSLNGFCGVTTNYLSDRIDEYRGEVWYLPLSADIRASLDIDAFWAWLRAHDGKPYDTGGAMGSALRTVRNSEDYGQLFCSELAAGALKAGDAIRSINPSEVDPRDLVRFAIYSGWGYLLKGDWHELKGYNTIDPEGFGISRRRK